MKQTSHLAALLILLTVSAHSATVPNQEPFPTAASKKGLQVQMIDDALALGIKHAALNVNLSSLLQITNNPESLSWTNSEGNAFYFHSGHVHALDGQVKTLSDSNVIVSLIILAYQSA